MSTAGASWQLDNTFPFGGGAVAASFAKGGHIELGAEVGRASQKN
jgi:hypothetical protein